MRRVVVTGLGLVSPIGSSVEEVLASIKNSYCGIGEIKSFDTSDFKVKLAAEVVDFDFSKYIDEKSLRRMDRVNKFGLVAALKAMEDSGLKKLDLADNERYGSFISSGIGGLSTIEREHQRALNKGYDRISPFFIPMVISNMTAGLVSMELGLHGYSISPVTACAGGNSAIGDGFRAIRDGYQDLIFAGGAEASITPLGIGGFSSMNALSTSPDASRGSIPFDKERSGFVMGEGGAILVLEELDHARKRGAKIYGELLGYGVSSDANHITAPDQEGRWAGRAMELALEDAGLKPENIDYINAHGTSTPLNDLCETKAIKRVFGNNSNLKLSSTKSMTGHLLGASGAIEALISLLALQNSIFPPNINYQVEDEACDLYIVANEAQYGDISYVMSNSLGFGGHNSSIIMGKWVGEDEI